MFKQTVSVLKHNFIKMSVFTQKLNPLTGQNDWIIQNENYDYHQEVARSSFADMLHDTERNKKYESALKIAIKHMHANGKKANVLDIGTGTGLLSMMAVRNGADSVIACEAFKPMSECALKIIRLNEMEGKIKIIPKRSTEITVGENCDMETRANILVTEVFDTELIGEGALSTFKHAHEVLLEKDCVTVPLSATIYAQIVESPYLYNWNKLKDIYNEEGDELLVKIPQFIINCPGASAVHDIQLSELDVNYVKTIANPQAVFRFDWSGKTPFVYEQSTINTFKAVTDGEAQGVFMWWDLQMDLNNEIILSCAPYWAHPDFDGDKSKIPWRDHWMQAVYYFPKIESIKKGEEAHLISCHDEYSLWFNLKKDLKITDAYYQTPLCDCGLHLAYSRTRIGQMNDFKRVKKMLSAFENAITNDSVVLAVGNGFITSLSCAKIAKKVIVIDNNHLSRNILKKIVDHNKFSNVEIHESIEEIPGLLSQVTTIVSEPYFSNSILPWDNLLLIYLLRHTDLVKKDEAVKLVPKSVSIKCVPVAFDHLNKIRAPLVECEGFKMKHFDELIEVIMQRNSPRKL